jgi:hypothetical protein
MMAVAVNAVADNWPNWRGPDDNGVAGGTGYATSWSPTDRVLWRVKLPGLGASTPAVWGDRIVVTCVIDELHLVDVGHVLDVIDIASSGVDHPGRPRTCG